MRSKIVPITRIPVIWFEQLFKICQAIDTAPQADKQGLVYYLIGYVGIMEQMLHEASLEVGRTKD